jgi:RND family efflux transporter MFP subunit
VQQFQALRAARARLVVARKALEDTVVRAPFGGLVAERLVSLGDYVTRGTRVAVVIRTSSLRVQLTVPEQYIAEITVGRPVTLEVDAYPGKTFAGQVRYVSPAVQPESRALLVEAVVPNQDGLLKPGLFATARLEQASHAPGIVVPASAVRLAAGSARLFVVRSDHVEERVVTTGQTLGDRVEITSGLEVGEKVVVSDVSALADGTTVTIR